MSCPWAGVALQVPPNWHWLVGWLVWMHGPCILGAKWAKCLYAECRWNDFSYSMCFTTLAMCLIAHLLKVSLKVMWDLLNYVKLFTLWCEHWKHKMKHKKKKIVSRIVSLPLAGRKQAWCAALWHHFLHLRGKCICREAREPPAELPGLPWQLEDMQLLCFPLLNSVQIL